jgi:hypothetical protein
MPEDFSRLPRGAQLPPLGSARADPPAIFRDGHDCPHAAIADTIVVLA